MLFFWLILLVRGLLLEDVCYVVVGRLFDDVGDVVVGGDPAEVVRVTEGRVQTKQHVQGLQHELGLIEHRTYMMAFKS